MAMSISGCETINGFEATTTGSSAAAQPDPSKAAFCAAWQPVIVSQSDDEATKRSALWSNLYVQDWCQGARTYTFDGGAPRPALPRATLRQRQGGWPRSLPKPEPRQKPKRKTPSNAGETHDPEAAKTAHQLIEQ